MSDGDPETLIQLSGMSVGSEVKIPGDVTTRAIKRLYSNGLFSDVSISVDRIVGNEIYLILHLKERQKEKTVSIKKRIILLTIVC